ncbi:tyrosine-type recombinase/integrase [Methylobacterium sp. W2]|uniref:tyrosine-type recombinase/integrase n=1 Tax=Methylobacterium sp. W2 TaxID=2598107 RepID=UPI001D0C98B3|nr:tyrosine-type recombinase/integrase [Methylobacterium sp. W2]
MVLPRSVHKIRSRGREYFYFQAGRGTDHAGPRTRLPDDPQAPEFWIAVRQAQGVSGPVPTDTVSALIDSYEVSPAFANDLSDGTKALYRRSLRIAREAWGNLPSAKLRPVHIQAMMDGFSQTRGKANNFLGAMRALSAWASARGHVETSLTEGVRPYPAKTGHKPWTAAQIELAHSELTGVIRRGVLLYIYTGQRGSDVVRLGWTDVEDGGFTLRQVKTGREVWCPIVPELAAEMATWERRPGPFLLQDSGKPFTRKLFSRHYSEARAEIPILAGASLHGLRCTAVIRLRRAGLSTGQIGDITGMSLAMIERYCRFADKKTSGQAALISLSRTREERDCKTLKN